MNTETFQFAKLALFNVRLLADIESHRGEDIVENIVAHRCRADNITIPVSLLHQSTFLQFAYINLVWLWEQAKVSDWTDDFLNGLTRRFQFTVIIKLSGPREMQTPSDFLRVLRNAISHGRVTFQDERVIFSDIDTRTEIESTKVEMSWSNLAKLSESVLFSVNDILYPRNLRTGA